MKNFGKVFAGILTLSFGVFSMVSCIKSDPDPLMANTDVIIQDMKTDAGTKYGIVIYAAANYEIKSAKVTAPGTGGKVYQLTATADKRQFVFTPQTAGYSETMPVKGDYTFEIEDVNGAKITGKDVVGDEKLAPIAIKTATMASHKLKVTWDKITGSEAYVVRLFTANKAELIFASTYLATDKIDYEFDATTVGWDNGKSPVVNTNYVVELIALKSETGVTADKSNNLQFITLDSKTIKWE